MQIAYIEDAPTAQKPWYVVPPDDHPWAQPGYCTQRTAAKAMATLGMLPDEIDLLLTIERKHPTKLAELENV